MLTALALLVAAQVPIEKQPDAAAWYRAALKARAARPDEKTLLALKPGRVSPKLKDDLGAFDWLEVGGWSYPEKKLDLSYAGEEPCQLDVLRHLPDGGDLRFQYVASCSDREHGTVSHLNFTMPPPTRTAVKELKGATYLEVTAYGEKELHRVVSYADGVLVYDISYDGKPNSKLVKFRVVRIALPRGFAWEPAAR